MAYGTRWWWRLKIFHGWVIPLPDLQGTWVGEIRSRLLGLLEVPQRPVVEVHQRPELGRGAADDREHERQAVTSMAALGDGVRRVMRAPAIVVSVWILTIAVSLPLALGMRMLIREHLGESLAADTALSGVNYEWWQEFADQAAGLGVTFRPTIIGFGAVVDNLSTFVEDQSRPAVIVGAACAYMASWLFLAGGIIDRYARDRATRSYGFFAASGVFFFRFLRLALVMWGAYCLLFFGRAD